jgi:4-hydroxybenzoate polyprenyltransferase
MPTQVSKSYLNLIRPRQWTKNLVCLGGAFFSGHIGEAHYLYRALVAVGAFCAASGFVYIINDILDRDRDRNHPRKRLRPIASGKVTVREAGIFSGVMLAMALGLGALLGAQVVALLVIYALMNVCYSAALKNLSLVDASVVAAGFILRIYVGTVAVSVSPSAWLLLCTLFLSLFLAFSKRRAELNVVSGQLTEARAVLEKYEVSEGVITATRSVVHEYDRANVDVNATRGVLHKYSVQMLDRFCNICATLSIATYALFTVLGHADHSFIITTPPVVMGIFRYIMLIERYQEGESPDAILLKDWAIQLAIVIWAILYVAVLYGHLQIDVQ